MNPSKSRIPRRKFLTRSAAVATGISIINARSIAGTEANSKIEIGLIGAGGRGTWLADLAQTHTGIKCVAIADMFDDRIATGREKLKVDADRCYKGLDAYKELIASKLDAVAIESPPYFHPEQATAAAKAGKHVYLAKPVSVDVPGCKAILNAGSIAKDKRSFFVDFQTRCTPVFMEAAKRVHDGAIGKPICGQVFYHDRRVRERPEIKGSADVQRLRNWVFDKALSGDIIVEQNVHVIDVANWYLQSHPTKAFGTGGRKGRIDIGDCWDHFIVTYWYPNDVLIDFSSSQFVKGFTDLCTRIYGNEGTVDAHYAGEVHITGDHPYAGGAPTHMYTTGALTNLKAFEESLRTEKYLNNAEESVRSSLTTILGRMAAYGNKMVTWDEMMKDETRLEPNLKR